MALATSIKAIETDYKGYRFRSRLEARWAVVWDAFALAYEYEPEGFELPGGVRYLPDFFLPDWDAYVEIKRAVPADAPLPDEHFDAFNKANALADATGKRVVVVCGPPVEDHVALLFTPSQSDAEAGTFWNCGACGVLCLGVDDPKAPGTIARFEALPVRLPHARCQHEWGLSDRSLVASALLAGIRARFEFGEKGR
jgi:hypothetical protein